MASLKLNVEVLMSVADAAESPHPVASTPFLGREGAASADRFAIRELVENWAIYRDSGDWERFRSVWSDGGWMTATWFQGPADAFIEASRTGLENGVSILHFLGGTTSDVSGDRAIAQTKMTISQRGMIGDVEVDVVCTGRFYDFIVRERGAWRVARRQPVYEKDRVDPVRPDANLSLDADRLQRFPIGYRHLAYLQEEVGYTIRPDLPGLRGEAIELLYREGAEWLSGSETPGAPL